MKLFKIYLIAVAIFATISATAAEKNDTNNQIDIFKEWGTINRQISAKLEPTLAAVPKVGEFTKEDFSNWKTACGLVIDNYKKMGNYNGTTEPTFDLPNEWKLNGKLYKAIKDGKSVNGIDETLASKWETAYKAFENEYKQVKKSCEEKYSELQKGSKETSQNATKIDTVFVYKSMYDHPDSIDKMNNLVQENKRLTEQNNLIQAEINSTQSQTESNTNGFRVCCTFPLAVKYYPNGVKVALEAATQMELAKTVTDPELLGHWKKYKPLLTNYGKYNDEVIKYLQEQKAYMANRGWKIDNVDVISIKRNLTTELSGYGSHYQQDYCIKYLDYVINKYFDRLEKAAAGKFTLSPAFYDFFIENELTPTEY